MSPENPVNRDWPIALPAKVVHTLRPARLQISSAMNAREDLRVAIDAKILPWRNGGVAHALIALLRALAELPDGNESYRLVVSSEEEEAFWRPELRPNQDLVREKDPEPVPTRAREEPTGLRGLVAGALVGVRRWIRGPIEPVEPITPKIERPHWPEVPISNGFYESLDCNVLHIPWQNFILCALPTIYNPHDLQHLHLPQFFTPQELAWKETMYHMGCRFAQTVVVGSQWAKDDIVRQYALDPSKVLIIPEGSPGQLSPLPDGQTVQEVRKRYGLPETYVFYPAIIWPHKNHLRLLEALALLRDERGLAVSLVCTGTKLEQFWPRIEKRIRELKLEHEVQCLGFVPEADLRVIQGSAHCLVQPSLFEASSLPIFDAWLEGVPVACSRATALPEQVGDAGLLFDPLDTRDIADAIAKIVTNPEMRSELRTRGFHRLKDFDWNRTAKAYRAAYRRAAGLALNEEDRWLLQWNWMREPGKLPYPAVT